jgi:DNA-binding beta-propeller fold protein YncE
MAHNDVTRNSVRAQIYLVTESSFAGNVEIEVLEFAGQKKLCAYGEEKMKRFLAFLVAAIIVFITAAAYAQSKPPLRPLQTIPLPDIKAGDFDHFAADLAGNRLFLTAEAGNAVLVMDLRANKLIHTIPDLDEPHSLLYLPATKQLWVVVGGDGTVKIFDSSTYALVETVKVTDGADSSAYDPAKHLFYIAAGGSDAKLAYSLIDIVDTRTRKKVGEIKVDSTNIEALALEKNGPRIFANIRDKSLVGVIDREKKTVTATWPLGELHGNTPIAYDDANHRIFVAGRKPPSLVVLDSESGKIVTSLPIAEMTDDMAFDPASKRIYVACNEYAVVLQQRDADHYEELGRVATGFRAKTNILVPQLKRYYVAAPRHENEIAGVKVFEVE